MGVDYQLDWQHQKSVHVSTIYFFQWLSEVFLEFKRIVCIFFKCSTASQSVFKGLRGDLMIQSNFNLIVLKIKQQEQLYTVCQSLLSLESAAFVTLYGYVIVILLTLQ